MDKLKNYLEIARAYDVGTELPQFIQTKIDHRKALEEVREELERIPAVDVNGSDLKEQFKAQANALSQREGARLIDYARYEQLLEQQLLIKSISMKVAADLDTLGAGAMGRLLVLLDNLPNSLTATGLLPAASRLISLVKVEGNNSIVSASAHEWEKEARQDRRAALRNIKEGYYPYLSLVFITGLDELEQRRKGMAALLAPVGV